MSADVAPTRAVAFEDAELANLYAFFAAAGALKDTMRSARTIAGRPESVAEHSWRLTLMAAVLMPREAALDPFDVVRLCLIHDLGEIVGGDVPAPLQAAAPDRKARERRDFLALVGELPAAERDELVRLFDDYDQERTAEARFVKGLDKLETLITHAQGANPADFDYTFNFDYGRTATAAVPVITALRALADARTRARHEAAAEVAAKTPGG